MGVPASKMLVFEEGAAAGVAAISMDPTDSSRFSKDNVGVKDGGVDAAIGGVGIRSGGGRDRFDAMDVGVGGMGAGEQGWDDMDVNCGEL
jgi:hypothetical protein